MDEAITLVGGGQIPKSFDELCHEFLLQHWPDWNHNDAQSEDEENKRSLLIPPIFKFRNPHFANVEIQRVKESNDAPPCSHQQNDLPKSGGSSSALTEVQKSSTKSNHLLISPTTKMDVKPKEAKKRKSVSINDKPPGNKDIIERQSDEAEYMVYQAIFHLVQDNRHRFLAIHSLNLDCLKVDAFRKAIFSTQPNPDPKIYREFDFVLIGPKIGIICIEVKSTEFREEGPRGLDNYGRGLKRVTSKAVEQLNYFEDAVRFLMSMYGLSDTINVEKVIVMPNIDKPGGYAEIDGIRHWFADEKENSSADSSMPELYTTIKMLLDNLVMASAADYTTESIVFERLAPPLLGLTSLLKVPNQIKDLSVSRMELDSKRILSGASSDLMNRTLSSQSYLLRKSMDLTCDDVERLKESGQLAGNTSKYVLLNLEQQKALNGGSRQFVVGAPGTGKTIILQEKVSRSLEEGKNVLVFAAENFISSYESLRCGEGRYEVKSLNEVSLVLYLETSIDEQFDAIFFDDSLDQYLIANGQVPHEPDRPLIAALWLMDHAPSVLVWVALDPYLAWSLAYFCHGSFENCRLPGLGRATRNDTYEVSNLHRVMRCSGNVFDVAFDAALMRMVEERGDMSLTLGGFEFPVLGHRIAGPACRRVKLKIVKQKARHEMIEVWLVIRKYLMELRREGYRWGSIAVICGQTTNNKAANIIAEEAEKAGIPHRSSNDDVSSSKLTITNWSEVSSMEWPVVVFVSFASPLFVLHDYERYRACSRATNSLIWIETSVVQSTWSLSQRTFWFLVVIVVALLLSKIFVDSFP